MNDGEYNHLMGRIIGAAIEVRGELGCGLLESIYSHCLVKELRSCGLVFQKEVPLSICDKGEMVGKEFFIDLLVENEIVLELKAVAAVIAWSMAGCKHGN